MRRIVIASLAATAISLVAAPPVLADHHGANEAAFTSVLQDDRRAEDRSRDQYRHPAETLAFFGIEPGMTVAEYSPGGGWYTRVLAPYVGDTGKYIAIGTDSDSIRWRADQAEAEARTRGWPQAFPAQVTEWTGLDAAKVAAYESDEVPDEVKGSVDRVVIFRSLHGMMGGNTADSELRNIREILADDGMVGVVQHRARADAPYTYSNGSRGYLREADVIRLFELNGFELVEKSEVNANANDPANWETGVWSLPPNFAGADEGSEERARRAIIGESDRMTLLFRKRG